MFSWRLAMAPPEVLDYVAAHEVAHLVRMDHSAAFWRVVATLCPQYALHRAWLRREGPGTDGDPVRAAWQWTCALPNSCPWPMTGSTAACGRRS
jgi:hypothetical protein